MRLWIIAALFAAACAAAPETPPPQEPAAQVQASPSRYGDARTVASDAEVRDARRAYRAACGQQRSEGYCECMTGGMAQALAPAELALATADFTGQSIAASAADRQRMQSVRQDVEASCAQFR